MAQSVAAKPRQQVGAYMRVSRIGGRSGEGYIALPLQRDRLESFAELLEVEVPEWAWFTDEDYTGGNTERPAFLAAVDAVERGQLDGLMVVRIDRFFRSVEDGVVFVDRITQAGGRFISASEHLDVSDPVGRYMLITMLNNAELALNMLKRGWVDAKTKAVRKRGVHIGPTPVGYLRIPRRAEQAAAIGLPPEQWEKSGWLVPHPADAKAVATAFEMRLGGSSWADIARWLDTAVPRDYPWAGNTVKRMLSNRVYLGEVRYGDLVNLDAHEPIVDRETFDAVQATIAAGELKRSPTGAFLLSGLCRCAHCRYAMGGFNHAGSHRDIPVYRCISRGARCDGRPMINAEPLEEWVSDQFWAHAARQQQRAIAELADGRAAGDLEGAVAELASLREDLEAFYADGLARRRLGSAYDRVAAQKAAAIDAASERVDSARRDARLQDLASFEISRDEVDREGMRDLLRGALAHVFVRRVPGRRLPVSDRVLLWWHDDPQLEIPSRTVHGPFESLPWRDELEVAPGVPASDAR